MLNTTLLSVQQLHNIIENVYGNNTILVIYQTEDLTLSFHTVNLQIDSTDKWLCFEDDRDSFIKIKSSCQISHNYDVDLGEVITIKSNTQELTLII